MRNHLAKASVAQSLDNTSRLTGSLRSPENDALYAPLPEWQELPHADARCPDRATDCGAGRPERDYVFVITRTGRPSFVPADFAKMTFTTLHGSRACNSRSAHTRTRSHRVCHKQVVTLVYASIIATKISVRLVGDLNRSTLKIRAKQSQSGGDLWTKR